MAVHVRVCVYVRESKKIESATVCTVDQSCANKQNVYYLA